jgi:2-phospho-L-lactate transferase/gluconeogenesis factor (CofD/UPF0052 family)
MDAAVISKSTKPAAPLPAVSRVLALCGGVGGAKLVLGLDAALGAGRLTVMVNTGDDFEHLGFMCRQISTPSSIRLPA